MIKRLAVGFVFLFVPIISHAKTMQLGADFVLPYKADTPKQRLPVLVGGHVQGFLNDSIAISFEGLFGMEDDDAFIEKPIYVIPGIYAYLPSILFNPYLHVDMPVLVNNNWDFGLQAGAGVLWNILLGVGLRYSIDVTYFFDAQATVINWAHVGAVFTF